MRRDVGKRGVGAEGAGDVEAHRKTRGTAAEVATPASNPCSLGARIEVRGEGNERGGCGLLIGKKKERNPCFNRRNRAAEFSAVTDTRSSLEVEEEDVTADVMVGPTGQREKGKKGWRRWEAALLRGLCALGFSRTGIGLAQLAGRLTQASFGLSNFFLNRNIFSLFQNSKQHKF